MSASTTPLIRAPQSPASAARPAAVSHGVLGVLILPFLSVILLNILIRQDLDVLPRAVASCTCLLAWLPFVLHRLRPQGLIPFMPVYGIVYGIYYGASTFLLEQFALPQLNMNVPDDLFLRAQLLGLGGLIAVLSGYYLTPMALYKVWPRVRIPLDARTAIMAAFSLSFLALLINRVAPEYGIPMRFGQVYAFFSQFLLFNIALLFYYQLVGKLPLFFQVGLWAFLLPTRLLISMSSGAVAELIIDMLVLMGVYWVARKKWPWRAALVFALIAVPLLGVKGEYRGIAWSANAPETVLGRAQLFANIAVEGAFTKDTFFRDSFQTVVSRIDMLTTFSAVLYLTPNIVPYWEGETYKSTMWALIPRVLYPDKPVKILGQDFGHRYGLLGHRDVSTSYNFPQVVEFYANFGPWGVFAGMFLVGMIFKGLYCTLCHPEAGEGGVLLSILVFVRLLNVDSDFSIVFGGIILNIAAFTLALKLLQARSIRLPMNSLRWR